MLIAGSLLISRLIHTMRCPGTKVPVLPAVPFWHTSSVFCSWGRAQLDHLAHRLVHAAGAVAGHALCGTLARLTPAANGQRERERE